MLLNQFFWGLQPELARSVSLHYPKSIAQAVSLAEATELVVKASRRPTVKGRSQNKGPNQSNRGRGFWGGGMGCGRSQGGGRTGILVDGAEDPVEEEENQDHLVLIHWRVVGAGCMAIWPVTIPNPKANRWEATQVTLSEELFINPGKKAHREDVDVVSKSDSQASTSCMTMRVILTPSMMQDSCMCPWILDRLLLESAEVEIEKDTKN